MSERLIAEALHPYPEDLVIATKGGLTRQGPNKWNPVGRPEDLQQCVEMSLRRLKLERIDLYQLHRIDPKVPVEETLGVLAEMQKAGKIRHVGLSEVTAPEIERARKVPPIDPPSIKRPPAATDGLIVEKSTRTAPAYLQRRWAAESS